jgi:DNA polymerase (family 10)
MSLNVNREHKPTNAELAQTFYLIGDLLELKGENVYKISAYRKAADTISAATEDISTLWKENRLKELAGVGQAISTKLDEILRTGSLGFLERLEEEIPPDLVSLLALPGVGAKTAMLLYQKLGIKGVAELEQAVRAGQVATIPGMGQKKEAALLKAIETSRSLNNKEVLLGVALPCARQLMLDLQQAYSPLKSVQLTGPLRRGRETVDLIDLVATSEEPTELLDAFGALPSIAKIQKRNDYKLIATLKNGLPVQLLSVYPEQLATTLVLSSSSDGFRSQLRDLAYKRGYELSLGGFIKGEEVWPASSEAEVFRYLGLPEIPPELRESQDEIKKALEGTLAIDLVTDYDLQGDLHTHSVWSDGQNSVEEMARTAAQHGYHYMLMSDHSKGLGMVGGLTEERLKEQQLEIARVNEVLAKEGFNFQLLSGAEVEIKADGSLDFSDEVLASMDIVVASLHSSLRQAHSKITERLLRAMHNSHVDIIAHPTGRLINSREPADLNILKVMVAARETGTVLEINAGPDRLDLKTEHVKMALEEQVKLVISSDSHNTKSFANIEYGVLTARRGGCRASDILNTLPLAELLRNLKSS